MRMALQEGYKSVGSEDSELLASGVADDKISKRGRGNFHGPLAEIAKAFRLRLAKAEH
jgi:hypothetical protein